MAPKYKMNWKYGLAAVLLFASGVAGWRYMGRLHSKHHSRGRREVAAFQKTVAGYHVTLATVVDTSANGDARLADHSWSPDGFPYAGMDLNMARGYSARAASGGSPRTVIFALDQLKAVTRLPGEPYPETVVDVFGYLPKESPKSEGGAEDPSSSGPFPVRIWHGVLLDPPAKRMPPPATTTSLSFGVRDTEDQPVVLGIAQGEFTVLAKGSTSVAGLSEDQTATLASGPWGRIEATHLRRPMMQSKPSPTHRFRLIGGKFPPTMERKALFFDSAGRVVATCGEGPNNPGYARRWYPAPTGPADIVRFEIQERPYHFVQFDGVCFDPPQFTSYSGQQGLDHAMDSPLGEVIGVLKPTIERDWSGATLYAGDGTRWIDPGQELAAYESGHPNPVGQAQSQQWSILFRPIKTLSPSVPVVCEVYAADSAEGAKLERLAKWNGMPLQQPITMIQCLPTKRPYIRLELQGGDGMWKKLDTIVVDPRLLQAAEKSPLGTRVFEVFYDESGSIRIWKDDEPISLSTATWDSQRQKIRAVAHMRDGTTVNVNNNMGGYSGVPPNEKRFSGMEFTRQLNGTKVQSGRMSLDFKDIASFELQVQDLKPPVSISIKSPIDE